MTLSVETRLGVFKFPGLLGVWGEVYRALNMKLKR